MPLLYYNATPNFGDQLNPYLWSHFWPTPSCSFMGIGTMLWDKHFLQQIPAWGRCIVFGSGFRLGSTHVARNDVTWDIRFVRGPLSSQVLSQGRLPYIVDSAYALRFHPLYAELIATPRSHVGWVPHYSCRAPIDGTLCIDPMQDVEKVLRQIAACRVILCGAMHGAIIADLLGIPWVRVVQTTSENPATTDFKWQDWAGALDLRVCPVELPGPSSLDALPFQLTDRSKLARACDQLQLQINLLSREFESLHR